MLIIGAFFLLNLILIAWCIDLYSHTLILWSAFKKQTLNLLESSFIFENPERSRLRGSVCKAQGDFHSGITDSLSTSSSFDKDISIVSSHMSLMNDSEIQTLDSNTTVRENLGYFRLVLVFINLTYNFFSRKVAIFLRNVKNGKIAADDSIRSLNHEDYGSRMMRYNQELIKVRT